MDSSLQGAIQKMGSNFIVAAFMPGMTFVVCLSIAFDAVLAPPFRFLGGTDVNMIQSSLNLLLFTIILGFTLFSISTYIYKAFEGYTFILGMDSGLRRSFLNRQLRRFQENEREKIWIERQIKTVDKKILKESGLLSSGVGDWRQKRLARYHNLRNSLYDRQYTNALDRSENFPPASEFILPTRFGNILRAAEMHPGLKYGLDAVPLWGGLAHVIPSDGMEKIDEANNQCLFLLNASLLAMVFAIICFMTTIYQLSMLWLNDEYPAKFVLPPSDWISWEMVFFYSALVIFSVALAWFFYVASLLNVSQYGHMIRAAYDLYRFRLIEAFHLPLPETLNEERNLWRRLNYFIVGNEQWEQLEVKEQLESLSNVPDAGFIYKHPQTETQQEPPDLANSTFAEF
jgi:hypothetical protein